MGIVHQYPARPMLSPVRLRVVDPCPLDMPLEGLYSTLAASRWNSISQTIEMLHKVVQRWIFNQLFDGLFEVFQLLSI